jgi:hypothetical protein
MAENRVETPNPKPEDYKHLKAWGIMMGSNPGYIEMEQRMASIEGAPLDAIYQDTSFGPNPGRWHRFCEVTNEDTCELITSILESMR